jgi:hypothetical protein
MVRGRKHFARYQSEMPHHNTSLHLSRGTQEGPMRFGPVLVLFTMVASFAVLAACSGVPVKGLAKSNGAGEIQRGTTCLAISGGGIRSGSVGLGVLQELQSAGRLSGFKYVSAVSGGGYPIYGLLFEMVRTGADPQSLLEEDSSFIKNADDHSDMVTHFEAVWLGFWDAIWFSYLTNVLHWTGGGMPAYEASIQHTFSYDQPFMEAFSRPSLADVTAENLKGFPYPIFVASANDKAHGPMKGQVYSLGDVFEISPGLMGAPHFGYTTEVPSEIHIIDAVAISGSAIDAPQGLIRLPDMLESLNFGLGMRFHSQDKDVPYRSFNLEDGGFIENLGIIPLIRRGCATIVAFDNSDDGRPFEAWFSLRRRLSADEEPGWRAKQLRGLNTSLEPPEYPDEDKPPSPNVVNQWKWELPANIWDTQLTNGTQTVSLRIVKLGLKKDPGSETCWKDIYAYAKETPLGSPPRCTNYKDAVGRQCAFPLQATAVQSYDKNEFKQYRMVGKCMVQDLLHASGDVPEVRYLTGLPLSSPLSLTISSQKFPH